MILDRRNDSPCPLRKSRRSKHDRCATRFEMTPIGATRKHREPFRADIEGRATVGVDKRTLSKDVRRRFLLFHAPIRIPRIRPWRRSPSYFGRGMSRMEFFFYFSFEPRRETRRRSRSVPFAGSRWVAVDPRHAPKTNTRQFPEPLLARKINDGNLSMKRDSCKNEHRGVNIYIAVTQRVLRVSENSLHKSFGANDWKRPPLQPLFQERRRVESPSNVSRVRLFSFGVSTKR